MIADDENLLSAALRTPADYAPPSALQPVLTAVAAGSFAAARNGILSLQDKLGTAAATAVEEKKGDVDGFMGAAGDQSDRREELKPCQAYVALCMLLTSYSASAVRFALAEYVSSLSPESQLDPVFFYIHYLLWKRSRKPSKVGLQILIFNI